MRLLAEVARTVTPAKATPLAASTATPVTAAVLAWGGEVFCGYSRGEKLTRLSWNTFTCVVTGSQPVSETVSAAGAQRADAVRALHP